METINNMASAAAKAVWGDNNADSENVKPGTDGTDTTTTTTTAANTANTTTTNNDTEGTEPISGKLGDTSKGEPFDAGNIESGIDTQSKGPTTDLPSSTGDVQSKGHTSELPLSTGDVQSKGHTSELPLSTGNVQSKGHTSELPSSTSNVQSKGPTSELPSSIGDSHFKAPQADIRDPDSNPTVDPKTETARKNVDDSGEGLDTSENPSKIDGPGPKTIDEVAKDRGGDAGNVGKGSSSGGIPSAGGAEAEGEDGLNAKSTNEGTGEQYVKSSGLAADGGDFDATKPGAGREADRLLEEKGVANPATAAAAGKNDSEESLPKDSPDSKEKKSLKDKIKAKLHKN